MVRHRMHLVAELGKYREALTWVADLNAARRKLGLPEMKTWTPIEGNFNALVLESDYQDLAEFDSMNAKFHTSPETMTVFRRGNEWGSHSHWPKDEILVTAQTIA